MILISVLCKADTTHSNELLGGDGLEVVVGVLYNGQVGTWLYP